MSNQISSDVAHTLPNDLLKELKSNSEALLLWEDITPLARNEFQCRLYRRLDWQVHRAALRTPPRA